MKTKPRALIESLQFGFLQLVSLRSGILLVSLSLAACGGGGGGGGGSPGGNPDGGAAALGYFKASNTGGNAHFGFSVAFSADGNTLAVGSRFESSDATGIDSDQTTGQLDQAGAVYVFTRSAGGPWSQQAYVKASNTGGADNFGTSVALSADGSTLVVGAPGEASIATGINDVTGQADNNAPNAGAVYVFIRSAGVWSQQAYVKASNTGADDNFGISVALSANGDTFAVGAWLEDSNATGIGGVEADNSFLDAGAVYVFTRSANVWTQQAYVKASNTDGGDLFGTSVALAGDGNTLAVGAHFEDSNATGINNDQNDDSIFAAGAVYVFTRSEMTWSQQAYVKASNTPTSALSASHLFGIAVALSGDGNTLAVGAQQESSSAVGINGNQSDISALQAGAVYVFTRSMAIWSQQAYVKASNTDGADFFGGSVALSGNGNLLAVGAFGEASNATGISGNQADDSLSGAGAVYVFTRSGISWAQQGYVKATNTGAADLFGSSVALSGDGSTLAVGAHFEDGSATGINGTQDEGVGNAGAVYLYSTS